MSGIKLELNTQGARVIGQALKRLKNRLNDISPVLERIGSYLTSETQFRFEDGLGPDGRKWVIKKDGEPSHLREKGHLMQSITYAISGDSVQIGTNVVYAPIHHLGGKTGRNHSADIPARPYLGLSNNDEFEIQNIIAEYIKKSIR